MNLKDLSSKYSYILEPAFPSDLPQPNKTDLQNLTQKYGVKFPKSYVDFQLIYCHKMPMGDLAFVGFGWANKNLDDYLNLENIVKEAKELNLPAYLTPFKYENGDFWCFDTRTGEDEFEVVIWDHNANDIDNDPDFKWQNFIEWLDTTMEDEDDEDFDLDNEE